MTSANTMAAEILEASAGGFASAAISQLARISHQDDAKAAGDFSAWHSDLAQRVLELAASVRAQEPRMFAERVLWLRRAWQARGLDAGELKAALESLKLALEEELPQRLLAAALPALDSALDGFAKDLPVEAQILDAERPEGRLAMEYLRHCLEGRTDAAIDTVIAAMRQGLKPLTAYIEIVIPVQREVGHLWHLGNISIAEERVVTETTRQLMTRVMGEAGPISERSEHTVLAACVEGDVHDLGLRVVLDLFKLAGFRTLFLGQNVPDNEIARAAGLYGARIVTLSATLTVQLKALESTIQAIKAQCPDVSIIVGGMAFEGTDNLWKRLGADGYADSVLTAVALGRELAESRKKAGQ